MDGSTFDQLTTRIAKMRVNRLTALRGLAAGVVTALTGLSLTADEAGADRKKPKKVRICHRGDDPTILGTTRKVTKKQKKNHLRKHAADYKGKCTASRIVSGGTTAPPAPPAPPAPRVPPAPPGFNCSNAGCVGERAGLVCDTTTGQCVNCQTFADCGALQACFSGRCQGFVGCSDDGDCEGIAPSGLLPGPICNDNNESPEIEDDVCIFNPLEGACNNNNDCVPFMGLPTVCVLGACFADCRQAGDDDCDKYYIPGTHHCVGGICFV
jgi:hypothetical protein